MHVERRTSRCRATPALAALADPRRPKKCRPQLSKHGARKRQEVLAAREKELVAQQREFQAQRAEEGGDLEESHRKQVDKYMKA